MDNQAKCPVPLTDPTPLSTLQEEDDLGDLLLEVLPGDGSTIGNLSAREALARAAERKIDELEYTVVKERLLGPGLIFRGQVQVRRSSAERPYICFAGRERMRSSSGKKVFGIRVPVLSRWF